jgi:Xaa-Pro aminopeptidase
MSASFQNHWALYLAIQHERYWAEAGRTFILSDDAKTKAAYQRAQEIVAQMAAQLKPGNSVVAIAETGRKQLGEFYATSSVYGLGNGIGLDQWESPFVIEDDARQLANRIEVSTLQQDMTLALRVVFETEGKLIIFGDTYEVTAGGAKSLLTNS